MAKRKPTDKIVKTVTHLAQHPTATISEAMREGGYAESTIDKPKQNFTGLPTVQSLAEEFQVALHDRISNERIVDKLSVLMDAQKIHGTSDDFIEVDDAQTQLKATQLVMQAKQLFGSITNQTNVQVNFGDLKSKYNKESDA